MFPLFPFLEHHKVIRSLYGILLLALTLLVFYLDVITKDIVAFDIFYFPSIMLITWYFGTRAGVLMAILDAMLWFIAERRLECFVGKHLCYPDAAVHLFTFLLVCWLTGLIYRRRLQLEEATRELERSNAELEQFAYKAAHDLQAPLATIFNFTEYLAERQGVCQKEASDHCNQSIQGILNGTKRMSVMIRELLDYARVGKKEEKAAPLDLNKVVQDVLASLSATITEKKAEVILDSLPTLKLNAGLANILFQNLIANALKYCENTPRIHVSASRKGKEWIFSVKDNGIGIPQEDLERVFIMFEKLPTRKQYPGSGIGLATCQKIVEHYHGRIWVESKTGEGSTFYFSLPIK